MLHRKLHSKNIWNWRHSVPAKVSSTENAILMSAALSGHNGDTGLPALWLVVGMEFKLGHVTASMRLLLVRLISWRRIFPSKIIWNNIKIVQGLESKRKNVEIGHAQWHHQADREWILSIEEQIRQQQNSLIGSVHYCLWKRLQKILAMRSLLNPRRYFLI